MIRQKLTDLTGAIHYNNPAPIVRGVKVRNPAGGTLDLSFDALINTGSDVTIVPASIIGRLNVRVASFARVHSVDRNAGWKSMPRFALILDIPSIGKVTTKALALERENIVLGRDVLKDFLFFYDGKESRWSLCSPSRWRNIWLRLANLID